MKGFKVTSGRIQVSDPCYDGGTHEEPALNGTWVAKVDKSNVGSWGTRISKLLVHHEGWNPAANGLKGLRITVGVDSGQMGVFDAAKFGGGDDEDFYGLCCDATLTQRGCGYVPMGFVSSSGLGDGAYDGIVWKDGGKAVAVEIVFLTD